MLMSVASACSRVAFSRFMGNCRLNAQWGIDNLFIFAARNKNQKRCQKKGEYFICHNH